MPPEEEERKVSPADDDKRDYSSIPFTLSGEDAIEDDRNHPEPALIQQSEQETNYWNTFASNNIHVHDNDETDSDYMSVNSIATQPGGISELSPSDNGLEMVEDLDGMDQTAAVPDNTTSAQEKSTKPIGIGKICGNGEKESPIEIFSDDEDDADEDIPQLWEMAKEREDSDQSDKFEEVDGMNQAAAVPDNMTSGQEKSTKPIGIGKICGKGEKESPIETFLDNEDDADEDISQLRKMAKEREDSDQSDMVEEVDGMNQAAAVPDFTTSAQEKSTKPICIGKICGNGEKESPIEIFTDGEDDTNEDIPQLRERTKEREDTDQSDEYEESNRNMGAREGVVSPAAMQTSQASYMRHKRRGRHKKNSAASSSIDDDDNRNMCVEKRKTQPFSLRRLPRARKRPEFFLFEDPTRKRKRRFENTGKKGFLRTSEDGHDYWVVEKLLGRRIKEKENVLGVEYLCRWEGYPKYTDTWQPAENLNERLIQIASQQFPYVDPGADEVDPKEDEAKEPTDTGNDHAYFGHVEDEREASGGRGPLDRRITEGSDLNKRTLPNYEKDDKCERYDSFDPQFDHDDQGPQEATIHEDNAGTNSYGKISWQKEQAEDKVNDDEHQIRGTGTAALPTRIPEKRNRSRSPDISIDDCHSETDNTDEDEDDGDFDVRVEDLIESCYKAIGGLAEVYTTENTLLRVGTSFHAENGRILTIRDLLGKEEIALCEIYIPSSDTLLSDTKAELDEYFPAGQLVRVPFSNLKKRCNKKFRRAKWFYESGEIEKYDCAFYRKEKGRRIPPTKLGKAKPTVLELFAGAGGMSLGFKNAGFDTKWAVEKNSHAAGTLRANIRQNSVREECVRDFIKRSVKKMPAYPKKGEVDHIHASPPCQGVSRANRFGSANDEENNSLSFEFLNAVRHFEPKTATYENVKGLLMAKNIWILKKLIAELHCMGYQVRLAKLNSSDYGDPQNRKRVILWGAQTSMHLPMKPQPTHGKNLMKRRTVEDAIGCLKSIEPYTTGDKGFHSENGQLVPNHCARISTPTEEELERYTLKADRPAHTIKSVNHAIHYNRKRFISVREAASLQSFPIDHQFSGRSTDQFKQIGNAVPVMMATQIARSVAQVYGLP